MADTNQYMKEKMDDIIVTMNRGFSTNEIKMNDLSKELKSLEYRIQGTYLAKDLYQKDCDTTEKRLTGIENTGTRAWRLIA